MLKSKNSRLTVLAGVLIVVSTAAVLLARQFTLGPTRPAPAWRALGPENAPLQIYEYTDFACPACKHASEILEEAIKVYGTKIRLSFKHYPLKNIHPWSMTAAAYADCAGEQGKFREYAALLFAKQENWGLAKEKPKEFEAIALELKLDWPKMQACSEAPETVQRVKLDMAEGDRKQVEATPTFFVNGKRAVGGSQLLEQVRNFDNLLNKIEIR